MNPSRALTGSMTYFIKKSGHCSPGTDITSLMTCRIAAQAVGKTFGQALRVLGDWKSCFLRGFDHTIYFNPLGSDKAETASEDFDSLCKAICPGLDPGTCTKCETGGISIAGTCVRSCGKAFHVQTLGRERSCATCGSNCLQFADATSCTVCQSGFYAGQTRDCYSACSPNCAACNIETGVCTTCANGTALFNDAICVKRCPAGTYRGLQHACHVKPLALSATTQIHARRAPTICTCWPMAHVT